MKNLHEDRGKKGAVLKGKRPKVGDRKRGRDDMDR
jgi:ATP-dependent RNA helicase DDX47/RRP3